MNTLHFKVKSNSSTITSITQSDLDDAETELNKILPGSKAERIGSNGIKITTPSKLFPCFRTGLSIGYAFL
jgi:hypothetical protein